ncbi:Proteinase inhibitor type-2 [Capsicum chinense]|nr:Proteinase inhibitor type-2 [Capsicum chinense]
MAVHKEVSFLAFLLVLGIFLLHADAKACTKECGNFAYGICPRSEGSAKEPICTNCCSGYKGCNYYSADGTFVCEGEFDPKEGPKACPANCDPRIAYSKCPRSQGRRIHYPTGCTNCCTGYKGCYYFGKDGKFVCEGESTEPKKCPAICIIDAYMTCPSSGSVKIKVHCGNCCTLREGCKLYRKDGSLICTGEPQISISAA